MMALSDNMRGIFYMNLSMLAFTVNDTFIKVATQSLPLFQTIALRGALATLALLLLARLTPGALQLWPQGPDRIKDRQRLLLRSLAEIGATVLFLGALIHMPLANLSAIMQSLPLAVPLAAALVFGERIGWRRMLAILTGFVGVMIIIRPGSEAFDRWSLMGVGAVLCVVVRDLSTRQMTRGLPSIAVAIWAAASVCAVGLVGALLHGWQAVTGLELLLIFCAALALVVGYLFSVMVMRVGDIGLIAPFRYTSLLWAILFGWALFGTLPDGWMLIGASIVVASGIYTLLRERALRRAAGG